MAFHVPVRITDDVKKFQSNFDVINPGEDCYRMIMVWIWGKYLIELLLNLRQRNVLIFNSDKDRIPHRLKKRLTMETFEKARSYRIDIINFNLVYDFCYALLITSVINFKLLYKGWLLTNPMLNALISSGYWSSTWDAVIGRNVCYSILVVSAATIFFILLPSIYQTFGLDEKYGFNKQSVGSFIKNFLLKKLLLGILISFFFVLINNSASFEIGLQQSIIMPATFGRYLLQNIMDTAIFFISLLAASTLLYFLDPIFTKYLPLKEGPLRTRLEALMERVNFPVNRLFVKEESKHSTHASAYLFGIWPLRKIVLYDTLIKGYSDNKTTSQEALVRSNVTEKLHSHSSLTTIGKPDLEKEKGLADEEVEAVLAHELGHWKLNHLLKMAFFYDAIIKPLLLLFLILFFRNSTALCEAFGFPENSDHSRFARFIVVCLLLHSFITVLRENLLNFKIRILEYQADAFAVELGYGVQLKEALMKLYEDELIFPLHDTFYAYWYYSHPTLLQRLEAIDDVMTRKNRCLAGEKLSSKQ